MTSGFSTTSLGAVGGPRGVAAGALRVLIQFITEYDPQAIKQVTADLAKTKAAGVQLQQDLDKQTTASSNLAIKLAQARAVQQAKLTKDQRAEILQIQALRDTGNRQDLQIARQRANVLVQTSGLQGKQLSGLRTYFSDSEKQVKLEKQIASTKEQVTKNNQLQIQQTRQLNAVEGVRNQLVPRIAGLVTGAIGGIVGGAVLGVGFQLAQTALEQLGDKLQDIIDPARHARDAIADLGAEIIKLRDSETTTTLQATSDYLKSIGVNADAATQAVVAKSAADQELNDQLQKQLELQQLLGHADAVRAENLKLIEQILRLQHPDADTQAGTGPRRITAAGLAQEQATRAAGYAYDFAGEALQKYNDDIAANEATSRAAAVAQDELANSVQRVKLAAAAVNLRDAGVNAGIGAGFDTVIGRLQARRDALAAAASASKNSGNSAIQNQIDALQQGRANQQFQDSLRQNSEERELLLLKDRLKTMGENINLDKYSGKFLVAAIDAKIEAINKEGAAQDRLNKLQDIERAAADADKLKRSQGESIADFVERRAQANQQVLRDRQDLDRQDRVDHLTQLRDKAQDDVDLAQNAEDRKKLIADKAFQDQINRLQKQLQAQQKADDTALKAKQKALDDEIAAEQKKKEKVLQISSTQYLQQVEDAISAADTIGDIAHLTGTIQGLQQVKGFIEALVKAGLISPEDAAYRLGQINAVLNDAEAKKSKIIPGLGPRDTTNRFAPDTTTTGRPGPGGLAQGGLVQRLTNGSTMFGSNVRLGEEGDELGVVLSHSVVAALRQSTPSPTTGDIYIYGERKNPWAEAYRTKQAVKSALQELL
jgi:hypothetical protein